VITEQQSCAYDIRDAFYNLLIADPFFAGFTWRKSKMLPAQQNLIPYLGVFLVDEAMTPDGDANAGCIRFIHSARIGFSVIVANSTPDAAEKKADQAFLKIMALAYCDLHLMNPLHNSNPEGVKIEGITRGGRRMVYGAPSTDNETPFVELQYEASCSYRSEWYPDIVDTLDEIDVTTGIKGTDTPAEMANRQQVAIDYTFSQSRQRRAPLARPWLLARDQNRRINNG
jgi:hypothetical protein